MFTNTVSWRIKMLLDLPLLLQYYHIRDADIMFYSARYFLRQNTNGGESGYINVALLAFNINDRLYGAI